LSETEKQPDEPIKNSDNIHRDTVFYYSRERRLSRASPAVQAFNEEPYVRSNIFKTLTATRAHKLLLFSIVFIFIVSNLVMRSVGKEQGLKLGGNTLALNIHSVEETLILEMVKDAPKSGELYIGAVDIAVSPVMPKQKEGEAREDLPLFSHRIFFNPVESEKFLFTLPFAGTDFFVILRTESENKSLRLKVRED